MACYIQYAPFSSWTSIGHCTASRRFRTAHPSFIGTVGIIHTTCAAFSEKARHVTLSIERVINNQIGASDALRTLALIAFAQGQYAEAADVMRESLKFLPPELVIVRQLWRCYALAVNGEPGAAIVAWQSGYQSIPTAIDTQWSLWLTVCTAAVLAAYGRLDDAARLCSVADRDRERSDPMLWSAAPYQEFWMRPLIIALRAALGDATFQEAWDAGAALSWEYAADEAAALLNTLISQAAG